MEALGRSMLRLHELALGTPAGFFHERFEDAHINLRLQHYPPHRAVNRSSIDRYAIPFFYDPNTDVMIECLPGCSGPGNPPRYPPRTFAEYYAWFVKMNYRHQSNDAQANPK